MIPTRTRTIVGLALLALFLAIPTATFVLWGIGVSEGWVLAGLLLWLVVAGVAGTIETYRSSRVLVVDMRAKGQKRVPLRDLIAWMTGIDREDQSGTLDR